VTRESQVKQVLTVKMVLTAQVLMVETATKVIQVIQVILVLALKSSAQAQAEQVLLRIRLQQSLLLSLIRQVLKPKYCQPMATKVLLRQLLVRH
jgi:hypothetical protein